MKDPQPQRRPRRSATSAAPTRRFGGRATVTGVNYETRIAAWLGVQMLAGGNEALWENVSAADVLTITMQAPEAVDDIVLARKSTSAKIYLSAKWRSQSVSLTILNPAFADVIDAFARQFQRLSATERAACWLVWAVPTKVGERATHGLRRALEAFRLSDPARPLEELLAGRTKAERTAFDQFLDVVKTSWEAASGVPPGESELQAFSRRVRVEVFDLEPSGRELTRAVGLLADRVVLDPEQAARAWEALHGYFGLTSEYGTAVTARLLRGILTKAQIELKPPADYADEISRLQELTERNLGLLAQHNVLQPGADAASAIHLDRAPEMDALRAAADVGHLLVTGEPGSGKSGLIYSLARSRKNRALPTVLLLAEQISGRDWKGAANLPGFDQHPLDEILANWPSDTPGILFTDALDAVRDPDTQRRLRGLLHDVQGGRSGWQVVASVREFDLEHGRELREMFPGAGVTGFGSSRFAAVAHFHVPRLSDWQLDELVRQRAEFRPFIEHARSSMKSEDLHRSPFYLRLAAELMRAGVRPERVADWTSPAILLRKYWEERVTTEPHAAESKHALRAICDKMVEQRSTVIAEQDIPLQPADYTAIEELRRRGVLQNSVRTGGVLVGAEAIGFNHHLLHDYAIASALIPKVPIERLVGFVTNRPLFPVFYRLSFVFALEVLWDSEGGSRVRFWDAARWLEIVPGLRGITRIVAPALAARRVEIVGDLRPLLDALAHEPDGDGAAHRALRHLMSGLQDVHADAIRSSVEAWLRFALELSRLLRGDATLEWDLVRLLERLNPLDESRPLTEQHLLNETGCTLLAQCLASNSRVWRAYTQEVAIVAVCQSFRVAPEASCTALLALLTPERLDRFLHRELSRLAHNLHHLSSEGDEIVRRLFEAVFTREKEPGEWEERGSALMGMRLQTSDQWNSIRHTLSGYYGQLGGDNADLVTELACVVLNDPTLGASTGRPVLATVSFRGVTCDLVEDYASYRGHGFEPDRSAIATHFKQHLRNWAEANNQARLAAALDRFVRCNGGSAMWSMFLKAGAEHPDSLGVLLESVLDEPVFQIHSDYRYAGVELFGALHRIGGFARRERLERLILTLPERYHPPQDESGERFERWVAEAQRRLVGTLEVANIVLEEVRTMRAVGESAANEEPGGFYSESHTFTDAEAMEHRGIRLSEPVNEEMFRLRGELKHFLPENNKPVNPDEIERRWLAILQSERILEGTGDAHPEMVRELRGYLTGACANTAAIMEWPEEDTRLQTVRNILLRASTDPDPAAGDNDDDKDGPVSWTSGSQRIEAARGLPWLALRLGAVDEPLAAALRRLCVDPSIALRWNLTERLSLLRESAPALMWELLEMLAAQERKFIVLVGVVESLNRLWLYDENRVQAILATVAQRALASASPDHSIHVFLTSTHLFHSLRTDSQASEAYVMQQIQTCEDARAFEMWPPQLHSCRAGRWLTCGDEAQSDPKVDATRKRTWNFFFNLLSSARGKLDAARATLKAFGPDATLETEGVREQIEIRDRTEKIVHDIASQIYFASGAFAEQHPGQDEQLSPAKRRRFWEDSESCLRLLADEMHPSVAYHLVQTLAHLLPCAPADIFLLAARSIQTSAREGGFQYESQAVGEVVKLVQRTLADYPGLLVTVDKRESEVFTALLDTLDLFVEAGWSEARQLTLRLEEIFR